MPFFVSTIGQIAIVLLVSTATAQLPTVWQPHDVVTYFCKRWYHQSVVKNNILYIHGGIETFNIRETNGTDSTLGYNPFLLEVDLRQWWDWKSNISYFALEEKPNPKTGSKVRDAMVSGAMFHGPQNQSNVYTYGGTTYRGNESFPSEDTRFQYSEQYPLWSFDNATYTWNSYDMEPSLSPSYGAGAEASDQGLAFYLNGRVDNGTAPATANDGHAQTLLDGMMKIDMLKHTATNLSTAGMKNYQPRIGGAMQYVADVGSRGILVTLGGQVFDGKRTVVPQDNSRLLGFDSVDVFDISSHLQDPNPDANGTWYSQTTSGDIPEPRIDFCTIVTAAPDNSSHNIWVYGGRDPTGANGTIFHDNAFVLSLPSFTWIKVHQGYKPRWGHTCHLVGGNQMLTVGGHNEDASTCDWHTTGVGVLDLSTIVWGSVYNADGNDLGLNYKLVDKIGGSTSGGATKTVPERGWTSEALHKVMSTTRNYDAPEGTLATQGTSAPKPNRALPVAAIVGVLIGGTVVVVAISCYTWLKCFRRKHRESSSCPKSIDSSSCEELGDSCKFELTGEGTLCEANGMVLPNERKDLSITAEADPGNAVTYAVELPTTNFAKEGKWGVPVVRMRSPSLTGSGEDYSWSPGDDGVFSAPRVKRKMLFDT